MSTVRLLSIATVTAAAFAVSAQAAPLNTNAPPTNAQSLLPTPTDKGLSGPTATKSMNIISPRDPQAGSPTGKRLNKPIEYEQFQQTFQKPASQWNPKCKACASDDWQR
jgi:hypothetical protein